MIAFALCYESWTNKGSGFAIKHYGVFVLLLITTL